MAIQLGNFAGARFRDTRVPMPLDVYEKTGNILQQRYDENIANEDKLGQLQESAKSKVADKNRSIVDDNIARTRSILSEINGNYHRANDIIRKAYKEFSTDPLLTKAVEDKNYQDLVQKERQERFKAGKITQDQLAAANIRDSIFNQKKLEYNPETKTFSGTFRPTDIPDYVDIEKEIIDLSKAVEFTKDKPGERNALYQKYKGIDTILADNTYKNVSDAARAYIMSSDRYKNYVNFMAESNTIKQLARKNQETGEYYIADPTVQDFRNVGFNISDSGEIVSEKQKTKKGEVQHQNVPVNIYNLSPDERRAQLMQAYATYETGLAENFARTLDARRENIHDITAAREYQRKLREDQINSQIFGGFTSVTPATQLTNYDLKERNENITALENEVRRLKSIPEKDLTAFERQKLYDNQVALAQSKYVRDAVKDKVLQDDRVVANLHRDYSDLLNDYPGLKELKNRGIFTEENYKNYVTGKDTKTLAPYLNNNTGGGELKYKSTFAAPLLYSSNQLQNKTLGSVINEKKEEFDNIATKHIKKNPVSVTYDVLSAFNQKGENTYLNTAVDNLVRSMPGGFVIGDNGAKGDLSKALTLDDLAKKWKVPLEEMDFKYTFLNPRAGQMNGGLGVTIVPNKNASDDTKEKFKDIGVYSNVIIPTREDNARLLNDRIGTEFVKSKDPVVQGFGLTMLGNAAFGQLTRNIDDQIEYGTGTFEPTTIKIPYGQPGSVLLVDIRPTSNGIVANIQGDKDQTGRPYQIIGQTMDEIRAKLYTRIQQ